ncbi:MAG: bacillithiol biosynthesis cysteine-adding enzyme BshC [Chitinophagaceae bacterium]
MFATQYIPYSQTNSFSKIVTDYLASKEELKPLFAFSPTIEGIKDAIAQKKSQTVDRKILVDVLNEQYTNIVTSKAVKENIVSLLSENIFTVCTAHQPNLFTGPLYFLYKILHAIRLSDHLKSELPDYHFVPVYYMGSEDADFDELNHTYVEGKKFQWKTEQKGAVGRMKVDKALIQLIDEMQGQLGGEQFGAEIIGLIRKCYSIGKTIQQATLEIVNELFGAYGLVVLIADHPSLKQQMISVFEDDLFENRPASIVQKTSAKLSEHYNVQAHPRAINLFYLKDDLRERVEFDNNQFAVINTAIRFSKDQLRQELKEHPERFSPNVILRGLYQETILPNIAFIEGGGELAYWLQLKDLFAYYKIVFPVLVLRNSFLIVEKKWQERITKLGFSVNDFFASNDYLLNTIVAKNAKAPVSLNGDFEKATALFETIREQASAVDPTLSQHVAAIKKRSLKTLQELEKKMLRAEKRKYADQQRQIQMVKTALFPNNGLQERVENFSSFYAKWGRGFIDALYQASLALEQEFCILQQQ